MVTSNLQITFNEVLIYISGIILGAIVVSTRISVMLKKIYISPKLKDTDINILRIKDERKDKVFYHINPKNFKQTLGMLFSFVHWRIAGEKTNVVYHSVLVANFATFFVIISSLLLIIVPIILMIGD